MSSQIEESLVDAIADSGGLDLLVDAGEFGLDSLMQEGILKDVPFLGTIAKLYQVGLGVKGYIFTKKVSRFLSGLSSIPEAERLSFLGRLDQEPGARKQVGETLLLLIERLDDLEKPELLSRAFKAYIRSEIDLVTFRRLALAIDRCFTRDLEHLDEDMIEYLSPEAALGLVSCGLLEPSTAPMTRGGRQKNEYQLTRFGDLFARVVGHV